jgi:hypothetical protein
VHDGTAVGRRPDAGLTSAQRASGSRRWPPTPATGPSASIGNGATAVLVTPTAQRRGRSSTYFVVFSANVEGTVTFTFLGKGKNKKVTAVVVESGKPSYRWRVPRSWRKGIPTVLAGFAPAIGSPFTGANTIASVRIK